MRIPTDKEIRLLHKEHAPTREAFELVYTHCEIVCSVAEQLLERAAPGKVFDGRLVRAGCLLHDIGVYRLYDEAGKLDYSRYIQHGVLGHDLLAEEGFPEALRRFCSHHTGVGISQEDVKRQELPLPLRDYLAESPEERLVMYADKFHSKASPPVFVSAPSYAKRVGRFGEEKTAAFNAMCETFGIPDITSLASLYENDVV
ncbi:HD domain-containing protein [Streptosporangium algeriense]|uniref:HD domain-containing protein n=1 Tax=Streptosporangium algeriense TaxID=1682748 RepID=A0ABW3DMC2_9ACTN